MQVIGGGYTWVHTCCSKWSALLEAGTIGML